MTKLWNHHRQGVEREELEQDIQELLTHLGDGEKRLAQIAIGNILEALQEKEVRREGKILLQAPDWGECSSTALELQDESLKLKEAACEQLFQVRESLQKILSDRESSETTRQTS